MISERTSGREHLDQSKPTASARLARQPSQIAARGSPNRDPPRSPAFGPEQPLWIATSDDVGGAVAENVPVALSESQEHRGPTNGRVEVAGGRIALEERARRRDRQHLDARDLAPKGRNGPALSSLHPRRDGLHDERPFLACRRRVPSALAMRIPEAMAAVAMMIALVFIGSP